MRSTVIGIGTILVIFLSFVCMSTIATDTLMYQEESIACNEAIYETELMLTEEEDSITSNDEFKEAFMCFVKPLLAHPDKYTVKFYGVDYQSGLLSVGISYNWIPWMNANDGSLDDESKIKTIEARRTIIIDEEA